MSQLFVIIILTIPGINMHVWIIVSGFQVKVVASENYIKRDSGLIYRDFEVGKGDCPQDGQQVFISLSLIAMGF